MAEYDIGACGCCEPQFVCPSCLDDSAPEAMTVELSGFTNGTCSNCNNLNGIWEIPGGVSFFGGCGWSEPGLPGTQCYSGINVDVLYNSGTNQSTVRGVVINTPFVLILFQLTGITGRLNCNSFNELTLPFASQSGTALCNPSSAVFKLTSGAP